MLADVYLHHHSEDRLHGVSEGKLIDNLLGDGGEELDREGIIVARWLGGGGGGKLCNIHSLSISAINFRLTLVGMETRGWLLLR